MNHYIYIDDIRNNDKWYNINLHQNEWQPHICRSYKEAINLINVILYSDESASFILDLDHDLGETEDGYDESINTGYDICKWIVENQIPLVGFHIHSMNVIGAQNMRQLLTHYGYKEI